MITTTFFLFLPLCIILSTGENCDYQWTQIQDRELFEQTYEMYNGNLDPARVGAFIVQSEKKIFYYQIDTRTILHEIEHAKCHLENKNLTDREYCHVRLDMADVIEKSSNF